MRPDDLIMRLAAVGQSDKPAEFNPCENCPPYGWCKPCTARMILDMKKAKLETLFYRQALVDQYYFILGVECRELKCVFQCELNKFINKIIDYVNQCIADELKVVLLVDCATIVVSYLGLLAPACYDSCIFVRTHWVFVDWIYFNNCFEGLPVLTDKSIRSLVVSV